MQHSLFKNDKTERIPISKSFVGGKQRTKVTEDLPKNAYLNFDKTDSSTNNEFGLR